MKKLILSIYVLALSCESPKHENQKPETEELFNCLSDSVQVVTISKDLPLLTTPELSELERLQMIPEKERKRLLKIGEINIFRSGEKLEVFRDKNGQ
ncbi:MAG: hypothetical protein HRU26_01435, partial [Psychroserpens sp.]|nr:hypothetical protein [Psychroserpens sp.]